MAVEQDDPRVAQLKLEHAQRNKDIEIARRYYAGEQYAEQNLAAQTMAPGGEPVPEHDKHIAYSTQVQECIDYVSALLGKGFQVTADDKQVQAIVDGTLSASPDLASDDDADTINVVSVLRDALVAGDVAVRVRWDPETQLPWLEFWESEAVDFHFADDNRFRLERVILTETVWVDDGAGTAGVEVSRERTWEMQTQIDGTSQCVIVTRDDGEIVGEPAPTGLDFIPWRMWRGQKKRIRAVRGETVVTKRMRDLADRYDAVEHLAFRITRYNSHGNLAVIGDGALLTTQADARVMKDVADVLTFPGGTDLIEVSLNANPEMIQHQRDVILDAMFSAFGISRLDSDTVKGLGDISGYALEILNRKSEGTFDQIGKQLARDIRSTLNLALDMHALLSDQTEQAPVIGEELPEQPEEEQGEPIDVDEVFTNRKMTIVMGTGYIVDDAMQREDFTAGLVSRRYVLEKRGLDPKEIDKIQGEVEKEKKATQAPTVTLSPQTAAAMSSPIQAGQTLMSVAADQTGA